jgi:diadenosine tetraphosphate (Ap4A) HIT family hydrolase
MENENSCIFCKIIAGQVPCAKIWEDDDFLAILDAFPNTRGMTLVLPKKHYNSDAFLMPENDYQKLMSISKKVADLLKKSLKVNRVALVMEGMGVNHVHIKLYPLYGIEEEFKEIWAKEQVFFEKYQGYLSTQLGPKANLEELKKIAETITKTI